MMEDTIHSVVRAGDINAVSMTVHKYRDHTGPYFIGEVWGARKDLDGTDLEIMQEVVYKKDASVKLRSLKRGWW